MSVKDVIIVLETIQLDFRTLFTRTEREAINAAIEYLKRKDKDE